MDEKTQLFNAPLVIFNHPDMEVKAYHLARMLSKEYLKEFQVVPAGKFSDHKDFMRNFVDLDLMVYWE